MLLGVEITIEEHITKNIIFIVLAGFSFYFSYKLKKSVHLTVNSYEKVNISLTNKLFAWYYIATRKNPFLYGLRCYAKPNKHITERKKVYGYDITLVWE